MAVVPLPMAVVPAQMPEQPHPDSVTALLRASSEGNRAAFDRLVPIVYDELRRMAHNRLRSERDGHTLNTTALVHETWLRLVHHDRVEWRGRAHFFAIGARAMRRVLVDHARARNAERRGGGAPHVSLGVAEAEAPGWMSDEVAAEVVALDDALRALAGFDPRGADVVEYRFFAGLGNEEIADVLDVSEVTVRRAWVSARAWLRREMGVSGFDPSGLDRSADGAGPPDDGGVSGGS